MAKTPAKQAAPSKAKAAAKTVKTAPEKPSAGKAAQATAAKPAKAIAKPAPAKLKTAAAPKAAVKPAKNAPAKSTVSPPPAKMSVKPGPAKAPAASAKASAKKAAPGKTAPGKPAVAKAPEKSSKPKPAAGAAAKPAAKATAPRKPATPRKPPAKAAASSSAANAAAAASKTNGTAKAPSKAPYSGKPWLMSYSSVVPPEIGPLAYSNIGDLLVDACRKFAGRPAFTCMDKTLTYAEVAKHAEHFGAFLQSKGLKPGARVAIMMPNVLQYPVAMMGILRAGYTVVNVNPLYTPRELEHQLKDSGAEAIVILENFATTLQTCIAKTPVKHVIVAAMGDMLGLKGLLVNLVVRRVKKMVPEWNLPGHTKFPSALKQGAAATFKPANPSPDDIAFLQYTGGTTGVSKGATLLHRNILANVAQNILWQETAFVKRPKPERMVFVCPLPLYHIYALTVNALMGMYQGAQNLLIPNPRDIPAFVKELQKVPVNVFPGLNTLFNALLNNEDFRKLDFKPLYLTFAGGMAAQKPVADRWRQVTGVMISEGYGLSETSPVATTNRFDADDFTGTIGLPISSTEIAIRDDDGNDVSIGEVGEICIRGPQVMAGYWNRPDETAKVMTADGFFKSGDMGFMDDKGYTKIVDRKKDMILVSGFNVYPNELEEVVAQHPGVLEVAAIGVPDDKSGEVPKLFIVKKDGALTDKDVLDFCRKNLTGYKVPRFVEFRTELPKSPVGKILRKDLRG
jgi:long-chain acyl-CoA synthetase